MGLLIVRPQLALISGVFSCGFTHIDAENILWEPYRYTLAVLID
jgi:hypothetical protein